MKKKKNLLFVFADQWRAGAMGYAGEDPAENQHIVIMHLAHFQYVLRIEQV